MVWSKVKVRVNINTRGFDLFECRLLLVSTRFTNFGPPAAAIPQYLTAKCDLYSVVDLRPHIRPTAPLYLGVNRRPHHNTLQVADKKSMPYRSKCQCARTPYQHVITISNQGQLIRTRHGRRLLYQCNTMKWLGWTIPDHLVAVN